MTRDESVIARLLGAPRRDWRFWVWVCVAGGLLLVGSAFVTQIHAKDDALAANKQLVAANKVLEDKVTNGNAAADCRAAAASFHEEAKGVVIERLADVVVAAVKREDLGPYSTALDLANDNARIAQQARADATDRCTADPTYRISPSILNPIPEPGGTP